MPRVVAATGDDKVNLVVSLLAKTEFGVPRGRSRQSPQERVDVRRVVGGGCRGFDSPMLSALVEEAVSVGDLVRLFTFRQCRVGRDDIAINLPVVGHSTSTIDWPQDTVPVAVVRGTYVKTPDASLVLEAGDEHYSLPHRNVRRSAALLDRDAL